MPFQSQAQWRWAFATHQEFADRWAKMTPGGKRRFELLAKRKRKRTTHKHLPGKHDQSAHGKPGRVGSAFRGAYSAARAGGASHVEARNQAKTAAEQVREQMRAERREQAAANPKPKRTAPPRAETPGTTKWQAFLDKSKAEFAAAQDAYQAAMNDKNATMESLTAAQRARDAAGEKWTRDQHTANQMAAVESAPPPPRAETPAKTPREQELDTMRREDKVLAAADARFRKANDDLNAAGAKRNAEYKRAASGNDKTPQERMAIEVNARAEFKKAQDEFNSAMADLKTTQQQNMDAVHRRATGNMIPDATPTTPTTPTTSTTPTTPTTPAPKPARVAEVNSRIAQNEAESSALAQRKQAANSANDYDTMRKIDLEERRLAAQRKALFAERTAINREGKPPTYRQAVDEMQRQVAEQIAGRTPVTTPSPPKPETQQERRARIAQQEQARQDARDSFQTPEQRQADQVAAQQRAMQRRAERAATETPATPTTPTSKRAQIDAETLAKYDRIRARAERRIETGIDERTGKKLTRQVRAQEEANLRAYEEATGETIPYLQRIRDMIAPEITTTRLGGSRPDAIPKTREITSRISETDRTITATNDRRNAARQRELDARARLAKIRLSNGKGIASNNSLLLAEQDYKREQTARLKLDDELKQLDKDRKAQARELAQAEREVRNTTKADDSVGGIPRKYGARAGEVITGNLGRDTGGKFTRVGSERDIVRAAINRGIASAGGGKRGAKRAAVSAAQKKRQQADTGAGIMDKLGFDASDWDYIASNKPQDPTDPQFARLIEQGLMDNVNGEAYPSALGRKIAAATGAGDEDKAKEILARERAKRGAQQAKRDAQVQAYDDIINDKTASPRARAIAARKRAVLVGTSDTSTKAADSYTPPAGVQAQAKRGLALRSEFGRGGTPVGIARARDLSNGKSVSRDTIMRMVSFFARHAVDKRPGWSDPSKPSNGYIAHLLWGGDAGRTWANSIAKHIKANE